ncbi:MAG: CHAT domain-containing protein [Cyanobacteria bacterium P01_A01_bin.135]
MDILYVDLLPADDGYVTLRYGKEPSNWTATDRRLALSDIQALVDHDKLYYFTRRPDFRRVGQQLYAWLDAEGRWLTKEIQRCAAPELVLMIAARQQLAHLPWEVLHDGDEFLVQAMTPVVPVRWVEGAAEPQPPQARSLNVMFMATSIAGEQALDFEAEEAKILEITDKFPLTLRVEESGCVAELKTLWKRYNRGSFDIFHLTGHAGITKTESPTPFFITETETGDRYDATAKDLFQVFRQRRPRLVFLSGCRTGQSLEDGTVNSIAKALVAYGLPAVLGWGQPVRDRDATLAATKLYESLAAGDSLPSALCETMRHLRNEEARDWHLLRLYARTGTLEPLVQAGSATVYVPPLETTQSYFLDDEQQVRVAGPDKFVGRRRLLQRCLQHLLRERGKVGVLLHGLGGNGKSTVAARLLDRLQGYTPAVIYRRLDEAALLRSLARQATDKAG